MGWIVGDQHEYERDRQLRRSLNSLAMMRALLRDALDGEGMEFRILYADLPGFLERW